MNDEKTLPYPEDPEEAILTVTDAASARTWADNAQGLLAVPGLFKGPKHVTGPYGCIKARNVPPYGLGTLLQNPSLLCVCPGVYRNMRLLGPGDDRRPYVENASLLRLNFARYGHALTVSTDGEEWTAVNIDDDSDFHGPSDELLRAVSGASFTTFLMEMDERYGLDDFLDWEVELVFAVSREVVNPKYISDLKTKQQ